jgi:prevent-host-death family protein
MEVNIHEAKTHFSKLLQRVAGGEEITIANAGVPVARLVPIKPDGNNRKLGVDNGLIKIADDFDAPLPEGIVAGFLGANPKRGRSRRR